MNKIVDELVAQVATDSSGKWVAVADLPEFVQLIVQECAQRLQELGQPELGKGLMKHFGVEE
jgi:predicted RNA-binding Zn ribbon-like protein